MAEVVAIKGGTPHMKLLKQRVTDALVLSLVALMGLSTFGIIEAVSVDAEPTGPQSIGTPDAYGHQTANPPMGDGCGVDIVLLVDERDDITAADSDALRLAVDAFTDALAGSDSRVAIIPFADHARVADASFELIPATPTTTPRASGGSNWESAFKAAAELRTQSRADAQMVTVLLTAGPPNRHLIGADDQSLATSAPLGIHMLEAVTAANTLKADMRVIAVGVGQASEFRSELAAVSGRNWSDTALGTTSADTDVLLVPSTDDTSRVMADLAADFCSFSTTLRVTTADTGGSGTGGLAIRNTTIAVDRTMSAPIDTANTDMLGPSALALATDIRQPPPEIAARETVTEEIVTDQAGIATMKTRLTGSTDLVVRPDVVGDHVSGSCLVNGEPVDASMENGEIIVTGVHNGDDVSCQFRLLDPGQPLVVTHHSAPGNVACDATTPIDKSVVLSAVGGDITHCIEVINAGDEPLDNIEIESDVTADDDWHNTTNLEPGESVLRRVVVTLDKASHVLSRATASTSRGVVSAADSAVLDTLPPAMAVARGLVTADDSCDLNAPLETAIDAVVPLCYEVTNTGGTALVDITVVDEAAASPEATRGTPLPLGPGETATIRTVVQLTSDSANASAVAQPADNAGNPIAGAPAITADTNAAGPAIQVDHRASESNVMPGEHVDFAITVSNPGAVPLENVVVDESACTADVGAPDKLVANADDTLDPGEAWLYRCTEPIDEDIVAIAAARATALGQPLLSTAATRVSARRVDMTINKKSDQRLRFGDVITYRIESYSFGPDTVDNAKIIDELPPGLDYVGATVGRGSCGYSGRTVTCDIGRFEPLERIQVLICTKITDASWVGKVIINEARVTASTHNDRVDKADSHIDRVQSSSVTTTTRRPTTLPPEDQTSINALSCASGSTVQSTTTTSTTTTTTTTPPPTATRSSTTGLVPTTAQPPTTIRPEPTVVVPTTVAAEPADRGSGADSATTTTSRVPPSTRELREVQRPAVPDATNLAIAAPRPQVAATTRMANTGVNSDALLANALVFLAAGLAVCGLARRRRLVF